MSGIAAYKAQLKLGGVPTIFTNEPLISLSLHVYRITDPVKRVLSANHDILIIDGNDDVIPTSNYRINYLEGVINIYDVEFLGTPVTISGRYIPLTFIGGSKEYSLEIGGDVLDDTAFHSDTVISAGYRTRQNGIHDISCSFSRWNNFNQALTDAKLAQTPVFVSINPGASKTFIKGWFQIETDSLSGDIGSLEDEALSLVLCGNNAKTYFSYSYNFTNVEASDMDETDLIANYFFD